MEIGCNVGRNLNFLFKNGFNSLEAIEVNANSIKTLNIQYPEMAKVAKIHNATVEDVIKDFDDGEFDVVFTMAVLEHIHSDSEWIFNEIVRIAKQHVITIEDEKAITWRHFPRNYKRVFKNLNMKQLQEYHCKDIPELGDNFFARVFCRGE